jgi:late competence protein required for DNA uptake (superfamily II DNA/RNA helicase)
VNAESDTLTCGFCGSENVEEVSETCGGTHVYRSFYCPSCDEIGTWRGPAT